MNSKFDFSNYLSPFTWRYGSDEMRRVFSEQHKYELWRKVWLSLAKAQYQEGLLSKREFDDLKKNEKNIDIERILKLEKDIRHDVVAAIKEFAEKAKVGGGKIHLGATSMDIVDNTDAIRLHEALDIVEKKLIIVLNEFAKKIERFAHFVCMGYTHLQPAEPITLGYRLAFYAQDLLQDLELLQFVKKHLKAKGIKGAVGTSASYSKLLNKKNTELFEENVLKELNLEPFLVTNQTAPRKIEFLLSSALCSIAQSLYKFAFDLRIMQSAGFGEWQEPFGAKQVGSSAMPFKKNPIRSEQICSLSRIVFALSRISLDNASHMLLERTLDDSANRRIYLPEMFLALDEILFSAEKIIEGLIINEGYIERNLANYAPFAATEEILIEVVKKGADRQRMHELLREISMKAWSEVTRGHKNSMTDLLVNNKELRNYMSVKKIEECMNPKNHIGDAPNRAIRLAKEIKKRVKG